MYSHAKRLTMSTEELVHINVIVADRPYRLKIKPKEEEMVRKAAKQINEKIKEFQTVYEAKDKQDYLAMATILFAVEAMNKKQAPATPQAPDPALLDKLQALNRSVAEALEG